MKSGKTLIELAQEIERQKDAKKDYLADAKALTARVSENGQFWLDGINGGMPVTDLAVRQVAEFTKVPVKYFDRMREHAPHLLVENVNHWLHDTDRKRLVRTLDGNVRAFLSNGYRKLDNFELAKAVLPTFGQLELDVRSCQLTDTRMYIKGVTDKLTSWVKNRGDVIRAGVIVSNSEVGKGRLNIQWFNEYLACTNGMVGTSILKQTHVGRKQEVDGIEEYLSDKTRQLNDAAFFNTVKDTVAGSLTQEGFDNWVSTMRDAAARPIEKKTPEVVEVVSEQFDLLESERESVLEHLIRGGDLSQWGLANAITRTAEDVESYDRATELEGIGNDVIELSPTDWERVAV